MEWNNVSEYSVELKRKAREQNQYHKAIRITSGIPRIPTKKRLDLITQKIKESGTPFILGTWIDCINNLSCSLVYDGNRIYVLGE